MIRFRKEQVDALREAREANRRNAVLKELEGKGLEVAEGDDGAVRITDAAGGTATIQAAREGEASITTMTTGEGRVFRFEDRSDKPLNAITDPAGLRTEFELDPGERALEVRRGAKSRHRLVYDEREKLQKITYPDNTETLYHYDDHGRPSAKNDHTCDALRYAVMQFALIGGHVHLWREMYIPGSAEMGYSDVDHAHEIMALDGRLAISGTVADPSQPKTINLVNGLGLGVTPYERQGRTMDIKDGIAHLRALMFATHPLMVTPEPEPVPVTILRKMDEAELEFGVADSEMLVAVERESRSSGGDDWFGSQG